ncbi:hypothetical protein BH10ACT2_BH10ACT2_19660 [soil metagenome]
MTESEVPQNDSEMNVAQSAGLGPLVFISHDARDAELAEAFSKLLRSVSAGMIKTFHSSDKKGTEGIDFGDEWYKRILTQLSSTSHVVCLFTERSLDRPWILFEAGVATGKIDKKVIGVAMGVPLSRVSNGPFYQFRNMDDSEEDLTKLINQLAQGVPNLELDIDVVKIQIQAFKAAEAASLKQLAVGVAKAIKPDAEASAVAKLAEEMKALPSRVAERLAESGDPLRRRRMRRFHPMMFEEFETVSGKLGDPIGILMAGSLVRDEMPWLYELAVEAYRALKSGDPESIDAEVKRLSRLAESGLGERMMDFGFRDPEFHMMAMEFPRMLQQMVIISAENLGRHRRPSRKPPAKSE